MFFILLGLKKAKRYGNIFKFSCSVQHKLFIDMVMKIIQKLTHTVMKLKNIFTASNSVLSYFSNGTWCHLEGVLGTGICLKLIFTSWLERLVDISKVQKC